MKIFDLYETKDVKVEDPGLKKYINLDERLVLKSHGKYSNKYERKKVNVIAVSYTHLTLPTILLV